MNILWHADFGWILCCQHRDDPVALPYQISMKGSKDFQNKAKGWCWNQSCETSSRSSLRKAIDWRQRVCFMPPGLKLFVLRWKK